MIWRGKVLYYIISPLDPRIFYTDLDVPLCTHKLVKAVAVEHLCYKFIIKKTETTFTNMMCLSVFLFKF